MTIAEHLGKVAYDTYCDSRQWKSFDGKKELPHWDAVRPDIKEGWMQAARAVRITLQGIQDIWHSKALRSRGQSMKTNKPKSAITRISVDRLYNLGNYEHIKYSLSAEVPKGGSAKQTLLGLVSILGGLKPIKKPYDYEVAKAVLGKVDEQRTETERDRIEDYTATVQRVAVQLTLREVALEQLDDLGGTSKFADAKRSWGNDDDEAF